MKAGVYGGAAARVAGIPLVWHVHDRISSDYLPDPAVATVRFLLRHLADGVVANSAATLQTLGARPGRLAREVVPYVLCVPPGAERSRGASAPGVTTFGMVGRITPWKGQDLFLRAFARAFPHGSAHAVIVGSAMFGEQDYERDLLALAHQPPDR